MAQFGFVGVGAMGEGMVRNLLAAGHGVRVYNRTRSRAEALVADGAEVAETPEAACRDAGAVLSILADDRATEAVTFDEGGLLAGLAPGAVHACMATISVELGRRLGEARTPSRPSASAASWSGTIRRRRTW
jgi:3-hydroxyisobutyrate dehydrogenase-like beta-hydroxyacid dehydrogenase